MFEFLRPRLSRAGLGRGFFASRRRAKDLLLEKLKYLMACLEETNRVRALKHRIDSLREQLLPAREFEGEVRRTCDAARAGVDADAVFAYAFARAGGPDDGPAPA